MVQCTWLLNMANKFNIHWQVVRTKARKLKDPYAKVAYVIDFYNENPNTHNHNRVSNWLRMTAMAYKDKEPFDVELQQPTSSQDMDNDLSKIPKDDLQMVYKDLSKRKYGFQFNKTPQAHVDFMAELEKHI